MLTTTKTFDYNIDAYLSKKYRYIINQGGSSSSKTFSVLQLLTIIAQSRKLTIDIASESVPHLKRGVLRDLPAIFDQLELNFDLLFNKSDNFLKFKNGSRINFIALDMPGKARGSRRDILFINEANLIPYETALQLFIRTHETIFIDYNPTNAFWVHQEIIPKNQDKCLLIKTTYKDNQYLPQSEIDELESRKGDNNFWRVYGLGELGKAEGLVFDNVEARTITDAEIKRFDRVFEGIDWGYIHPFVFLKIYYDRKRQDIYIFDEIHESHLSNAEIIKRVKAKHSRTSVITADSEDRRSNEELEDAGLSIERARKGEGSVNYGMKKLQSLRHIYIDPARCPKTYKEFIEYAYIEDTKNGGYKAEYPKLNDDAISACRYALEDEFSY